MATSCGLANRRRGIPELMPPSFFRFFVTRMNYGINALQVDVQHLVPLLLRDLINGNVQRIPDSGISHQNIYPVKMPDG